MPLFGQRDRFVVRVVIYVNGRRDADKVVGHDAHSVNSTLNHVEDV